MKALLFDYGGTLDTAACHWSYVIEKGYQEAGICLNETDFRTAYVYGERTLARNCIVLPQDGFKQLMLKKVDIEFSDLEAHNVLQFKTKENRNVAIEKVASYCDKFARQHVLEAESILKELSHRYKLIMVSNFYGNLRTILDEYGISGFFEDIVESSVVGVRKPDPAIWALGIKAAQCQPQEAIAIGDSFSKDILPAKTLGCNTIWFKGKEWEEKSYDETVPAHIITKLEDLLKIL